MSEAFARLMTALQAELAALDGGEPDTIEAATDAKLAALRSVRDGDPLTPAEIEAAQALNALAAARNRMLMTGVDRRLRALAAAAGRSPGLTYGRDGRTSL